MNKWTGWKKPSVIKGGTVTGNLKWLDDVEAQFGTDCNVNQKFATSGLPWSLPGLEAWKIENTVGGPGAGSFFFIGNEPSIGAAQIVLSNTSADMADKSGTFSVPQYDISNTPVSCFSYLNNATENILAVGGGGGGAGNATRIFLSTSSAVGDNVGISRLRIDQTEALFQNLTNGVRFADASANYLQVHYDDTNNRAVIGTNDSSTQAIWIKSSNMGSGATFICNNDTHLANKELRLSMFAYDTSQNPVAVFSNSIGATFNNFRLGGGSGSHQAATAFSIWTAPTVNNTGTQRFTVHETGHIVLSPQGSATDKVIAITMRQDIAGAAGTGNTADFVAAVKNLNNGGAGTTNNGLFVMCGQTTYTEASDMIRFVRPDGSRIGRVLQNATSSVQYSTTSDMRLKENIHDIENGLDLVRRLLPRKYNWKDQNSSDIKLGFMAQEMIQVIPSIVNKGDDSIGGENKNPYDMEMSGVVPVLTKAIQELDIELKEALQKIKILQGVK